MILNKEEAVETLKSFILVMHRWEVECCKGQALIIGTDHAGRTNWGRKWNIFWRQQQRKLKAIFDQYCVVDSTGDFTRGFSKPAEYNPREKVIAVDRVTDEAANEFIVIFTKQHTGFKNEVRYVLIQKGNKWLIESKAWKSAQGHGWMGCQI